VTDFYVAATGGSDGDPGSTSQPFTSLNRLRDALGPGDVGILKNGVFTPGANGQLDLDPSAGKGVNGTSGAHITFKAENERQAFLDWDGKSEALNGDNAFWWDFRGLRIRSKDTNAASGGKQRHSVDFDDSSFITFKRMLVYQNNRFFNTHLLQFQRCNTILVEDTELYEHHRHGIIFANSPNCVARRCYDNTRQVGSVPGGFQEGGHDPSGVGGKLAALYPSSDCIAENCIAERSMGVVEMNATGAADNNKVLGCIDLNCDFKMLNINSRGSGETRTPKNNLVENYVHIQGLLPKNVLPLRTESSRGTIWRNLSLFGNNTVAKGLDVFVTVGDGVAPYSVTIENCMFINCTGGKALVVTERTTFLVEFCNFFNNQTDSVPPLSDVNITNERLTDPEFGNVLLWVPSTSPNSGTGKFGGDIGANVIYKYTDGVLDTTQAGELWNRTTGRWKEAGVQIAGVNDIAGDSLFDINERLNVNFNGTTLPYSTEPPPKSGGRTPAAATVIPICDNSGYITGGWSNIAGLFTNVKLARSGP